MKLADMRLVLIEWADSSHGSGWGKLPEKEPRAPVLCRSVGWLAVDGAAVKVIVPHVHGADKDLDTEESGCGDMTIPTCAIVRISDLRPPPFEIPA